MQRHTRTLFTAFVGASALTLLAGTPSYALDIPTPLKYDMGDLGGTWTVVGGVEAALSGWNNAVPKSIKGGNSPPPVGQGGGVTGDIDLTNAMFIINSKGNIGGDDGFPLQFHAWVGEPPQTPVVGYTSPNVAPNLYSTEGKNNYNQTGHASFLFKGWATYAPDFAPWITVEGGRLPSVDGTEIGVGWLNNLPMLSDLNNMQTTVGDGFQINLISQPSDFTAPAYIWGFLPGYGSTLTIRVADGYKTGHMNELGFTGVWNLTPDGSDFIMGYGHTRLSVVGNGTDVAASAAASGSLNQNAVGGFGMWNSNLIGFGTVYNLTHRLSLNAEVETQWLPKSDIPTVDRISGQQDYYRWSTQWTFAYDWGIQQVFGEPIRVGAAIQPEFTYQHANTSDPNANSFGNFLGLDTQGTNGTTAGNTVQGNYGTFGAGSKMYAVQMGPSFMFHNAFLRPTVTWTHLASIDSGFGYGNSGITHDQVVLMLDFGWLLGQMEDTNDGQH